MTISGGKAAPKVFAQFFGQPLLPEIANRTKVCAHIVILVDLQIAEMRAQK